MNFMSGRSGFCEEITASRPIITSSSSPGFNFRGIPTDAGEAAAAAAAAGAPPRPESSYTNIGCDDSDDHVRGEEGGSGSGRGAVIEREHMFDKVVTPSDVGKLNRLVIPKQHAEKYFPLDSSSNEKGLLLNFEDRNGKPWRFRYSYWNSSQSYVMTKGWSRFVKEKKLDAGDIVSFQRGVGESAKDRLFIDWRHRPDVPEIPPSLSMPTQFSFHRSSIHPWSPLFLPPPPPSSRDYSHFLHPAAAIPIPNNHYHHHHHHHAISNYASNYAYNSNNGNPYSPAASIMYLRSTPGASAAGGLFGAQQFGGTGQTTAATATRGSRTVEQMVFNAVPVVQGKAAAKRLRLFGVNMDCPIPDESDDGCHIVLSSTTHPAPPTISLHHLPPSPFDSYSPPSSSTTPRPNPSSHSDDDNKGKASMSLDLDI